MSVNAEAAFQERIERERQFHDQAFSSDLREMQRKNITH